MFEEKGLSGIVDKLISLNHGALPEIDMNNPRRVMSALKRCLASGKTLMEMQDDFQRQQCVFENYDKFTVMMDVSYDILEQRVRNRVHQMINDGLIEEVEGLCDRYGKLSSSATMAIGYRETLAWLKNKTTEQDLCDKISLHTMWLVKKQKTWLKKQVPIDAVRLVK